MQSRHLVARFVTCLLVLLSLVYPQPGYSGIDEPEAAVPESIEVVLFHRQGCPHCDELQVFLHDLQRRQPAMKLLEFDIAIPEHARLFQQMAEMYGHEIDGVPTLFVGDAVIVGFASFMAEDVEQAVEHCVARRCASPMDRLVPTQRAPTLTLSAVLIGAVVDAVNPCAFAVLIILITTVLGAGGRRRALSSGLAFSLSIFISYYLMGLGLYSAVAATGVSRTIYIAAAVLALLIGLFNLKDYLFYGKWGLMEVPLSWRPRLKRIIGGVVSAPGAFLIGFAVSLFLLPCTSGPYVVILSLLAQAETRTHAMLWLLLYNAVFVLPMLAITLGMYLGLTTPEGAEAWRLRHVERLHLIAGILLLLLGIGMLVSLRFGWV